ncbi:hypothetical protein RB196_06595 [Streptomyces sp. PmtA]
MRASATPGGRKERTMTTTTTEEHEAGTERDLTVRKVGGRTAP